MTKQKNRCREQAAAELVFELRELIAGQSDFCLRYGNISFRIEPYGAELEIWCDGKKVARFADLDDMLQNFSIAGKPIADLLPDIEYE